MHPHPCLPAGRLPSPKERVMEVLILKSLSAWQAGILG